MNAGADPAHRAASLADRLLIESRQSQSARERRDGRRLARLLDDPSGKLFMLAMVDRLFRSADPARAAAALRHLLESFGMPEFLSLGERAALRLGAEVSRVLPGVVVPAVRHHLRGEARSTILSGEPAPLAAFLRRRHAAGYEVNINLLGEAVLGEEEAERRFKATLELLAHPGVDHVSVKISALCSQINLLARGETLARIKDRLLPLFHAAAAHGKIVNLDMEEFRDLELTVESFRECLDEPECIGFTAGLALQAYLPDSWPALQALTAWAIQRVAAGGAPIRVRLVKGANLAMESVEAEVHGWSPAPWPSKAQTDANFKRMLEFACRPEHAAAVHLGVGSHNLFDIALALVLRDDNGVTDKVTIEMLEGMAPHQARAVRREAGRLLVYAPVVREADFPNALAYLIRRLDENTAPGNFLRDLFAIAPGSDQWLRQRDAFLESWRDRQRWPDPSRRHIHRPAAQASGPSERPGSRNEPDTDWTAPDARRKVAEAVRAWPARPAAAESVDESIAPDRAALDPMLDSARAAQPGWEAIGPNRRAGFLRRAAGIMSAGRFDTIACMVHDAKKTITEADVEVSEAIDFARYYASAFDDDSLRARPGIEMAAIGVVAVTPPWNFPYAIPAGGVLAALMAGNSVVLKPSRETRATARQLAEQLWSAGVPRDVLQFFPCTDSGAGQALIEDSRVGAVILTGAHETAQRFLEWRPSLQLSAETSGKNALVVSALADRDLAIADLVRSAFGHSGQKCSAASLGILEAEVYDDRSFRSRLRDAAASLAVGPSTDPASRITPLTRPPGEALQRALTTLEPGEEWLLEPRRSPHDHCQWSPGIRLGVRPGSWFHQTECFGPVLGLMRARNLDHAIELQNGVDFGLTAGLHSLDEREIRRWRDAVEAGNLYINRPITGAVVRRQPFGGWKRSSIGPGAKAGGPNYVLSFCRCRDSLPIDVAAAVADYRRAWLEHFSREHDPSGLRAESNIFRYRRSRGVLLRLDPGEPGAPAIRALAEAAADITGVQLIVSLANEESDFALAARLPELASTVEFLRTTRPPSEIILRTAHGVGLNWIDAPFTSNGRLELRFWLREQSISETRHRYGNVITTPR